MERYSLKSVVNRQKAVEIPDKTLDKIRTILKTLTGFNLSAYKDKCIKRRISLRIRATRSVTAEEYCIRLQFDETERDMLLKTLTIHVSKFFRNPPTYEKLKDQIFPYLFNLCTRDGRDTLRLWSVGCACGEEPYSLALIMKDSFSAEMERINCSIHATDIDAGVLEVAMRGKYGKERLGEVPHSMKTRYFALCENDYQLLPEIQGLVTFAQGDLSRIGSYPQSDMIMCRNVLIYFERTQQEMVINEFAKVLPRGGILVLGKSETLLADARKQFQTICPVERIYRRK